MESKPESVGRMVLRRHLSPRQQGMPTSFSAEASCLSRYQAASYWKNPSRPPPPYLVAKLRRFEALHKRCGSSSELFKEAIRHLNSSSANLTAGDPARSTDCSYVV